MIALVSNVVNNRVLLAVLFVLMGAYALAQDFTEADEELKTIGESYIEDGDWAEASSIFGRLLKDHGTNSEINFRYGQCVLQGEAEPSEAIPYLEFSCRNPVYIEAYYLLGLAYHLAYRLDEALENYRTFYNLADKKLKGKYDVLQQIAMARRAKEQLQNNLDLKILDRREVPSYEFYKAYDLSSYSGKFFYVPPDLMWKTTEEKGEKPHIYMPSKPTGYVYYMAPGKQGLDIFRAEKKTSGFGKAELVPGSVNTKFDEAYPFLSPDGTKMYFSSKGHTSIGGYDLFVSTYDSGLDAWGIPQNMGFPINSTSDDMLYVEDSIAGTAHFTSNRHSSLNHVKIITIMAESKTFPVARISGEVVSEVDGSRFMAKVKVYEKKSDILMGEFEVNSRNSSFSLTVARAGEYYFDFEWETNDAEYSLSQSVLIEDQDRVTEHKYKFAFVLQGERHKLEVRPMGSKPIVDEDLETLTFSFANYQDALAINYSESDRRAEQDAELQALYKDLQATTNKDSKVKEDQLVSMAYQDADKKTAEAAKYKESAEIARMVAQSKGELAAEKAQVANTLLSNIDKVESTSEKAEIISDAKDMIDDSKGLGKESETAARLAENLESFEKQKAKDARGAMEYAKELDDATKAETYEQSIEGLSKQQGYLATTDNTGKTAADIMAEEAEIKQQEAKEAYKIAQEKILADQEAARQIKALEAAQKEAATKNDKKEFQAEIDKVAEQKKDLSRDIEVAMIQAREKKEQTKNLYEESELLEKIETGRALETEEKELPKYDNSLRTAGILSRAKNKSSKDIDYIPEVLDAQIFKKTKGSEYNQENPIPLNQQLPRGLVFKVQVGAYRNPIPQDLFADFAPILGETTEMGFIRYTVGLFTSLNSAKLAEGEVKSMGYKDAFVVAFMDGKRISIQESKSFDFETISQQILTERKMKEAESLKNRGTGKNTTGGLAQLTDVNKTKGGDAWITKTEAVDNFIQNAAGVNPNVNYIDESENLKLDEDFRSKENRSRSKTKIPATGSKNWNPSERELIDEAMNALFYTVQVGVYTKPVAPGVLYNLDPVNMQIMDNGYIKYTTEIYPDILAAIKRKNEIVEIGISDAFVTAFYQGQVISIVEAKELQSKWAKRVYSTADFSTEEKVLDKLPEQIIAKAEKDPVKMKSVNFKVYLGQYREDIPEDIAAAMLKLSDRGIEKYEKENGLVEYTAGNFTNIQEANALNREFIDAGVPDAKVLTYYNGVAVRDGE